MPEDTKQYEISLVLTKEDSYPGIISIIKEKVVQVLYENPVRRIRLSYPIKKEESGFFTWIIVTASGETIPMLQKELEMNPLVLRTLIITPPLPAKTERKSPRFKERETKDRPVRELRGALPPKEEFGVKAGEPLSNELLEKKLEEILK